jgi:hypothetical protein
MTFHHVERAKPRVWVQLLIPTMVTCVAVHMADSAVCPVSWLVALLAHLLVRSGMPRSWAGAWAGMECSFGIFFVKPLLACLEIGVDKAISPLSGSFYLACASISHSLGSGLSEYRA